MTLDEIRADILRRLDATNAKITAERFVSETIAIELVAHDRAVAAMPAVANGEIAKPKPKRAPRRDLAAMAREALTELRAATVSDVAKKIGVPPSRVLPALKKVGRLAPGSATHWERGP